MRGMFAYGAYGIGECRSTGKEGYSVMKSLYLLDFTDKYEEKSLLKRWHHCRLFFVSLFSIALTLVPATASYDHKYEDCMKISVDAYVQALSALLGDGNHRRTCVMLLRCSMEIK